MLEWLYSRTESSDDIKKLIDMEENRKKKARRLHAEGYSCSQCVLMACGDLVGLDDVTAAKIGAGLGAGVACGEICGVANAMAIAVGLKNDDSAADSKKRAMPAVRKLCMRFAEPNEGLLACRDIKGKCGRTCDELISDGVGLLEEALA